MVWPDGRVTKPPVSPTTTSPVVILIARVEKVSGTFFGFFRAATRTKRHGQTQPTHDAFAPRLVPKRRAALHTATQALQFLFRMRGVDMVHPVRQPRRGPIGQEFLIHGGA